MELVVWNSQGGKWDTFWTYYFGTRLGTGQDVMGLLVESGWGPWVTPGTVYENSVYTLDSSASWFATATANNSAFCTGIAAARRRYAFWVPWMKNLDAMKVNTRCSMGAALATSTRLLETVGRFLPNDPKLYLRPIFRFGLAKPSGMGGNTDMSVFLVHLVSGNPNKAQDQMDDLMKVMATIIPQGTSAIVVGDFNIDILGYVKPFTLPAKWSLLRTGVATQQSGGELDYALLYDPSGTHGGSAAVVVQQYKSGNNGSDHSVMRYTVPLS